MIEQLLWALAAGLLVRLTVAFLRPLTDPLARRLAVTMLRLLIRLDPRREDLLAEVVWIQTELGRTGLPEAFWGLSLMGGRALLGRWITSAAFRLSRTWSVIRQRFWQVIEHFRGRSETPRDSWSASLAHANSKGVTYFLNKKDVTLRGGKRQTIYYFSQNERAEGIRHLPFGYMVVENPRNGFLTLKRA